MAGERILPLVMPADPEALLDEEAFAEDEFMPYWAELWPSGLALADAVGARAPRGRVVELGCGLGLPSLVAAQGGAQVLATDWAQDAIDLLERNAERIGVELEARVWNWSAPPDFTPAPLVLAADVLYEARNVEALLVTLDAIVAPDGEAWIADPGRANAPRFFAAAAGTWDADEVAPRVTRLRRR